MVWHRTTPYPWKSSALCYAILPPPALGHQSSFIQVHLSQNVLQLRWSRMQPLQMLVHVLPGLASSFPFFNLALFLIYHTLTIQGVSLWWFHICVQCTLNKLTLHCIPMPPLLPPLSQCSVGFPCSTPLFSSLCPLSGYTIVYLHSSTGGHLGCSQVFSIYKVICSYYT
jgi:hypothetical protein